MNLPRAFLSNKCRGDTFDKAMERIEDKFERIDQILKTITEENKEIIKDIDKRLKALEK